MGSGRKDTHCEEIGYGQPNPSNVLTVLEITSKMEPSTPTHQARLAYITQRIQAGTFEAAEYTKRVESGSLAGDLLWPVGGSFTIAEPHSCVHCQDATLTQQMLRGHDWDSFALVLKASLARAVDACLSGCALYRCFVDLLTLYALDLARSLETGTDVFKFQLLAGPSHPRSTPSPPPAGAHPSGSVPPPASDLPPTPALLARISLAMEDGSDQQIPSSRVHYLEMFAREGEHNDHGGT